MTSNPEPIVQQLPHEFQNLLAYVTGPEVRSQTAYTVELPLILDSIHASESRWDTANARLGEMHPQRLAWVRAYLEPLRMGQTDAVITALEAEGKDPTCPGTQRQAVRRTVGYDRRNRPYLHYDAYLARGWPMGTGVNDNWSTPAGQVPPIAQGTRDSIIEGLDRIIIRFR